MPASRNVVIGASFVAVLIGLGITQAVVERSVEAQDGKTVQAPRFEVDPFWPKPLPNNWLLGSTIGVGVDAQDHVWIVHRGGATLNARTEMGAATDPKTAEDCCVVAAMELLLAGCVVPCEPTLCATLRPWPRWTTDASTR